MEADLRAVIVPDGVQDAPVLIRRTFTELPSVVIIKNDESLQFVSSLLIVTLVQFKPLLTKITVKVISSTLVLPYHVGLIKVITEGYQRDAYVEARMRGFEGYESCILYIIITLSTDRETVLSLINLSDRAIILHKAETIARAWPCAEENTPADKEDIQLIIERTSKLPVDEIKIGLIDDAQQQELLDLLQEYRDCFATRTSELGCAKSAQMTIHLNEEKPFTYRPYKMTRTEQDAVRNIVVDLLSTTLFESRIRNIVHPFC